MKHNKNKQKTEYGIAFLGDGAAVDCPPIVQTMHAGLSFVNRETKHCVHDLAKIFKGYNNLYILLQRVGMDSLKFLREAVYAHSKGATSPALTKEVSLSYPWGEFRKESPDFIKMFNILEEEYASNYKNDKDYQKNLTLIWIYRENFIDGIQMLDSLLKLEQSETTEDELQALVAKGRNAFKRLVDLKGSKVIKILNCRFLKVFRVFLFFEQLIIGG